MLCSFRNGSFLRWLAGWFDCPFRDVYAREVPRCGLDTGRRRKALLVVCTYIPPLLERTSCPRVAGSIRVFVLINLHATRFALFRRKIEEEREGHLYGPRSLGAGFCSRLPFLLPPCQHGFEPLSRKDETISHPPGAARAFPKVRDRDSWAALGPASPFVSHFSLLAPTRAVLGKRQSENHGLAIHGRAG
jgi:hypothetical protein